MPPLRSESKGGVHNLESKSHAYSTSAVVSGSPIIPLENKYEILQVLQHAFVYNFKTVVLAIIDAHSELIRSTIMDFSTELKRHFGIVLKQLKETTLSWG